jgi:hypothetical protein
MSDEMDNETANNLLHFYRTRYSQLEYEFLVFKSKAEKRVELLSKQLEQYKGKDGATLQRNDE